MLSRKNGLGAEWIKYRLIEDGRVCGMCGQATSPSTEWCRNCVQHQNATVLPACRALLFQIGKERETGENTDHTASPADGRELPVEVLLGAFPWLMADTVQRNAAKLKTGGAWLAHVMARKILLKSEERDIPIIDTPGSPLELLRNILLNVLAAVNPFPFEHWGDFKDNDSAAVDDLGEILEQSFAFGDANSTKLGILAMVIDLEKQGKIKIDKGNHADQQQAARAIIREHAAAAKPKEEHSEPEPEKPRGFHMKG